MRSLAARDLRYIGLIGSKAKIKKIYDARTNGGFEVPESPAPCVAADECHGAGAQTPQALQVGTGSMTAGGNVPASSQTKKHKKHKKHAAKKHKKKRHHRAGRGHGGSR